MVKDHNNKLLGNSKRGIFPQRFICLDTETTETEIDKNTKELRLKLGWACYVHKGHKSKKWVFDWFFFTKPEQIEKYILSKLSVKTPLYIFASNPNFDLKVIEFYKRFTLSSWQLGFFASNQLTYILNIHKQKYRIIVLAVQNYFPTSIKKLGEILGSPKITVDFSTVTFHDLAVYCKQDTSILVEIITGYLDFIQDKKYGKFALTAPSQAFNNFTQSYRKKNIWIYHRPEISEFARLAYHGGRAECYHIGEIKDTPIYQLDINSMYPYVMATRLYPVEFKRYLLQPDIKILRSQLEHFAAVAEVVVNISEPYIAKRINNRLCFPVGRFVAHVNTGILKQLYDREELVEVSRVILYKEADIFSEYVNHWYSFRKRSKRKANLEYVMISKLFLNSLYGKFAQRNPIEINKYDVVDDLFERESYYSLDSGIKYTKNTMFHKTIETAGYRETNHSFPAIAAHVTEYARMVLWHLMKKAGRENVFYCDTDSLFVNKSGFDNLQNELSPTILGMLKLEKVVKKLTIHGLKDYDSDGNIKLKGIRKGSLASSPNVYSQERYQGILTDLRQRQFVYPIVEKYDKVLTREYNKGKVLYNGDVIPFILG